MTDVPKNDYQAEQQRLRAGDPVDNFDALALRVAVEYGMVGETTTSSNVKQGEYLLEYARRLRAALESKAFARAGSGEAEKCTWPKCDCIESLKGRDCRATPPVQPASDPVAAEELCGAQALGGPCILPAGHNMGNLDIPSRHKAAPPASEQMVLVPLTTLEHLREYWNGNENERAMADALKVIVGTIDRILDGAKETAKNAQVGGKAGEI